MPSLDSQKKPYRITPYPIITAAIVVWIFWFALMATKDNWHLFETNWFMSVTMVFGSFIAGSTSEGGGAVAFPVMTLLFKIAPPIARDFSLLIQSVGMTAATFTIFCLRIPVEWRAVLYAGSGGAIGVVIGLDVVSPLLTPAYTKLFFVSSWLSFAGALYWINRFREREVLQEISVFNATTKTVLFFGGVLGGTVSGITGSGLDIIIFSILVLGFRVCEKVATPTSVVLMASNSLVGVFWREVFTTGMDPVAWNYWYVCVPVVVLGAPLGAWFIRNKPRLVVVTFLYASIVCQYVAALVLLPMTPSMWVFSLCTTAVGLLIYWKMTKLGARHLEATSDTRLKVSEAS